MIRALLLGIGVGGVLFTKKGKKIVNEQVGNIKKYVIDSISKTDIVQAGKEFLKGYNEEKDIEITTCDKRETPKNKGGENE